MPTMGQNAPVARDKTAVTLGIAAALWQRFQFDDVGHEALVVFSCAALRYVRPVNALLIMPALGIYPAAL
jgi:hypothetical protein